jgi:hypothetical protein
MLQNDLPCFDAAATNRLLESQFAVPLGHENSLDRWDLNECEIEEEYDDGSQNTIATTSTSRYAVLAPTRHFTSPIPSNSTNPPTSREPYTPETIDEDPKEEWPLQIAFTAAGEPRCCFSTITLSIISVSMFFPLINDACKLDLEASNCTLQY